MKETESMMQLPAKSTEFIAHRETMLLVEELLEYSVGRVKGTATIKKDNPFLDDSGTVGRNCLVEIIAQTVASGKGYEAIINGETFKTGFLVGVNDFNFHEDVKVNDKLIITSTEESHIGDFTIVRGEIAVENKIVALGNLKFYELSGEPPKTADTPPEELQADTTNSGGISINNSTPFFNAISESAIDFKISESKDKASASFRFNNNFIGFKGHFPDFPILPGVVMMETMMVLAEALCKKPLKIATIIRAKFSKQSLPGELLSAELSMTLVDNLWKINAKLLNNGSPVSSLIVKASSN